MRSITVPQRSTSTRKFGVSREPVVVVAWPALKAHCSSCTVRTLCLPFDLPAAEVDRLDETIDARSAIKRKTSLFRPGDQCRSIYAIRRGSFKTVSLAENGLEQVTGYHLPGDIIGTDGIASGRYHCRAVALEDSEVCAIPFQELNRLAGTMPGLRSNIYRLFAADLCRGRDMMLLLGSRPAAERLVCFLLDLQERNRARGYSDREIVLRLSRVEIASYLGLQTETISRIFSNLHYSGLLHVQGRNIKVLDPAGLRRVIA